MKKLILVLIFTLMFAPLAAAGQARITDVSVSKAPLKVSFQVADAFSTEIEDAVKSGLPTSFNYIIELNKVNSVLPNETVGRWEFRHTVKYDSLRDEYELVFDETGDKGVKVTDLNEMKRLMTSCSNVPISTAHLVAGQLYEVRIKAELHTVDLPFLINYMFFFLKFWDFDTGWFVYPFTP